jgi:drug/metabolite transporter (DMT)-like permease
MIQNSGRSFAIGLFAVVFMLVSAAGWQLLNRAGATGGLRAFVPGMVAIGGFLFLGEPVASLTIAGIVLISGGMVLASGALGKKAAPA